MTLTRSVNWRLVNGRVKSRVFKPVLASRETCVSHCSSPNTKVHGLLHCKNSAQTAPWKYIIANQRTVFCRLLQFLRQSEARAGYFLKQEQIAEVYAAPKGCITSGAGLGRQREVWMLLRSHASYFCVDLTRKSSVPKESE